MMDGEILDPAEFCGSPANSYQRQSSFIYNKYNLVATLPLGLCVMFRSPLGARNKKFGIA